MHKEYMPQNDKVTQTWKHRSSLVLNDPSSVILVAKETEHKSI